MFPTNYVLIRLICNSVGFIFTTRGIRSTGYDNMQSWNMVTLLKISATAQQTQAIMLLKSLTV